MNYSICDTCFYMVSVLHETPNVWWAVGSIQRSIVSDCTCPEYIHSPAGRLLKIKDGYGIAEISAFKWKLVPG
jgi:hypothetical protein